MREKSIGLPAAFLLLLSISIVSPRTASAYRPFDGTDGDVAELGAFELELGPSHWYNQGGRNYLLAPATVLNFGLLPGTELVIDLQNRLSLGHLHGDDTRLGLRDSDVLVKHILREGVLQEKSGLSIAAEVGPLLPDVDGVQRYGLGANGFGFTGNLIVSDRWNWGTLHFNEWPQYSRAHNFELTSTIIVEGPHEWKVRPVGELLYDKEWNRAETVSVLVGAIWEVRDAFALDLAVRQARIGDENAHELRLGFTWSIAMWGPKETGAPRD